MRESTFRNKINQIRHAAVNRVAKLVPQNTVTYKRAGSSLDQSVLKAPTTAYRQAIKAVTNTGKGTAAKPLTNQGKMISIPTKSKMNSNGEIINPTKADIAEYNKRYTTVKKWKPMNSKPSNGIGVGGN